MTKLRSPSVWVMTKEYGPAIIGGLGTVATELTKALKDSNVKTDVITASVHRAFRFTRGSRTAILRLPFSNRFYRGKRLTFRPHSIRRITARYLHRKPDVIHVHSLEFAQAALFFKRKYRIPVVYTCHSLVSKRGGRHTFRSKNQGKLLRRSNRIIVPSLWLKQQLRKRYPAAARRAIVIPHGVKSVSSRSGSKRYRLLFVGRLFKEKGIESLIRSVSLLSVKNRQVRLTVIGKGSRKYSKRLKSIARKKGISSKIRWRGFVPHKKVQRLYKAYGAVVVPSRKESFCLVALEAMASGIALVTTRAGGLKEFVNRDNAQIITGMNSKAIARAIQAMWDNPQRTLKRIRKGKLVAKRYSWRRTAARYKSVFIRLQKNKRRPLKRVKAR
ncbi:glycosyltransferase family 4 protein [Cohnella kolymensis]|uniref:glycosyltransferase family 4 protein n=1 Tax=Cohnella kolymensis TaxID=1590652 RepID=UPI000A6D93C9|nr:glycosyltransferase family 4 protein [Cohnella kolymensis]